MNTIAFSYWLFSRWEIDFQFKGAFSISLFLSFTATSCLQSHKLTTSYKLNSDTSTYFKGSPSNTQVSKKCRNKICRKEHSFLVTITDRYDGVGYVELNGRLSNNSNTLFQIHIFDISNLDIILTIRSVHADIKLWVLIVDCFSFSDKHTIVFGTHSKDWRS